MPNTPFHMSFALWHFPFNIKKLKTHLFDGGWSTEARIGSDGGAKCVSMVRQVEKEREEGQQDALTGHSHLKQVPMTGLPLSETSSRVMLTVLRSRSRKAYYALVFCISQ
jgi:hypothetical protein